MKTSEIKKIATQAHKSGKLNVDQLDHILADSAVYDKSARTLVKALHTLAIDLDGSEALQSSGKKGASDSRPSLQNRASSYAFYLKQVRSHPKMDREDEERLAKRLEFMLLRLIHAVQESPESKETHRLLEQFRDNGDGPLDQSLVPLLTSLKNCPAERREFIQACCNDYNRTRSEFVERNLHLVVHVSQLYRTYGIPLMDLIQEGNASLIRAVEKYDWRKGVRFQTYANFWIRQAIERWITANKSIVKVPNYLQQKIRRFRREGVIASDINQVSSKEISDAFELSTEVAGRLLETGRGHVSLDTAPTMNEETSIADTLFVEDDDIKPADEKDKLRERLLKALDFLTDQERFILKRRFGLEGCRTETLDEIGLQLKVSRERIRQLQIRALRKIKSSSHKEMLAPFLA